MAFRVVEREIRTYREIVEEEAWKRDHESATACLELEQALRFGIHLYRSMVALEEAWRRDVLEGRTPFDPKAHQFIKNLFCLWLESCDRVTAEIHRFENSGYVVERAPEFRKFHAEAKWVVQSPRDALSHDRIAALRDAALEENVAGQAQPFERLGD